MEEPHLYQQIAESIRQEILDGRLKPGDRLPSVREMALHWDCTIGTIQRAYQELAHDGLVTSRAGQGTRVVEKPAAQPGKTTLRRAALVNRAEAFLLEVLTAGYSLDDVSRAVQLAMDRWRVVEQEEAAVSGQTLRFAGSHDMAVSWMAAHFNEIAPSYSLQLSFSGSLGGIIALAEGKAEIAGSHLWDEETDTYNRPFVRRLLPGRRTALITLAHRRLGLIVPKGNPQQIQSLSDVARPQLRFVNRQSGSGTRVWLDVNLKNLNIRHEEIQGFAVEKMTHSEVARAVAEGEADLGLGLDASARAFNLDFILLTQERYDLIVPEPSLQLVPVNALLSWLKTPLAQETIENLGGYSAAETGRVEWVEA